MHCLTLKTKKSESNTETKKKRVVSVKVKKHINITQTSTKQNCYNQNQIILSNLHLQMMVVKQLKEIANYMVNYDLFDTLVILEGKIEMFDKMINADIDVASLYFEEIANITIKLENLRQHTINEKERFDYFVGQA